MPGTVCLTFDVDAEAGLAGDVSGLLSTVSERRFGAVRGLPRILDLLRSLEIGATFYVPGVTVGRHRSEIERILADGHEIGHHGHLHLRDAELDAGGRRAEIEDGLAALGSIGVTPRGYRSPAWELTPETLGLLIEHDFGYDSSCMGDDRPYWEGPPEGQILELPVHWSLDDWHWFGLGPDGAPGDLDAWRRAWLAEVEQAAAEDRVTTLTMHPEVIGRAHRTAALRELIETASERGAGFARHADVAAAL